MSKWFPHKNSCAAKETYPLLACARSSVVHPYSFISFCGIGLSIDSCCGIGFFLRISRLQALIPLLLILCKEYKLTERVLYRNRIFGQRERNSRSMSIPKEPEQVMKQRGGSVLGKKTILKSDHFPGCQNKRLSPQIDGAPNYRQVNPQNCFYLLLSLSLSLCLSFSCF